MSRARCAHGSRTTHHRTERVRVDSQQTTCKNIDWLLITRTTHNTNYNIYKYRRPKSCTKLRNSHIVRTSVHVAGTSSASRAPKNRWGRDLRTSYARLCRARGSRTTYHQDVENWRKRRHSDIRAGRTRMINQPHKKPTDACINYSLHVAGSCTCLYTYAQTKPKS